MTKALSNNQNNFGRFLESRIDVIYDVDKADHILWELCLHTVTIKLVKSKQHF